MNKEQLVSIIMDKMLSRGLVMIEISARHVHLTQNDVDYLFGKNYQLTYVRELSQKGQFLCKERVDITGPKGTIKNVAILGPIRPATQVEVAYTDARKLGADVPVRLSGDTKGSAPIAISNGEKVLHSPEGLIIAKRHIHMTPTDARRLNLQQGENVDVEVFSEQRVLTFSDTIIRIAEDASLAMHIDIDEANAASVSKLGYGLIKKVQK